MLKFNDLNNCPYLRGVIILRCLTLGRLNLPLQEDLLTSNYQRILNYSNSNLFSEEEYSVFKNIYYGEVSGLQDVENSIIASIEQFGYVDIWGDLCSGLRYSIGHYTKDEKNFFKNVYEFEGKNYCTVGNHVIPQFIDSSFDVNKLEISPDLDLAKAITKIEERFNIVETYSFKPMWMPFIFKLSEDYKIKEFEMCASPKSKFYNSLGVIFAGDKECYNYVSSTVLSEEIIESAMKAGLHFINLVVDEDQTVSFSFLKLNNINRFLNKDTEKLFYEKMKVGRFIKKYSDYPDVLVESVVNSIKAEVLPPKIEIVSGYEIAKYYNSFYYSRQSDLGTLEGSCMRYDRCQRYLGLYVRNSNVKLLIIKSTLESDKIVGRALIWENVNILSLTNDNKYEIVGDPITLLDRYYGPDKYADSVIKFAKSNGWYSKYENRPYSFRYNTPKGEENVPLLLQVQLEHFSFPFYPYVDTFCLLNPTNGKLLASDSVDLALRRTGELYSLLTSTVGKFEASNSIIPTYHDESYEGGTSIISFFECTMGMSTEEAEEHYESLDYPDEILYSDYDNRHFNDDDSIGLILTEITSGQDKVDHKNLELNTSHAR